MGLTPVIELVIWNSALNAMVAHASSVVAFAAASASKASERAFGEVDRPFSVFSTDGVRGGQLVMPLFKPLRRFRPDMRRGASFLPKGIQRVRNRVLEAPSSPEGFP